MKVKLALGTVQFGLSYGITNNEGQVQKDEVDDILKHAFQHNIQILDTASAYGNSETVLGNASVQNFKVISKIPEVLKLQTSIRSCLSDSLSKLKRESIYGLMFHNEKDLLAPENYLKQLKDLKIEGLVDKIGCSFYTVDALSKAFEMDYELDIIQVPGNCLDQRFLKSGLLGEAKHRGIEIHCRSLFLQGLLLDEETELPDSLRSFKNELDRFFSFCKLKNISPLMATLKFLQQIDAIDYGVVGCLTKLQLAEITSAYAKASQHKEVIDFSELSSSSDVLINPTLWK